MSRSSSTRQNRMRQGQTLQSTNHGQKIPKTTKGCDVSANKEEEKVYEDGRHSQCYVCCQSV